jgi:hypothetical protein
MRESGLAMRVSMAGAAGAAFADDPDDVNHGHVQDKPFRARERDGERHVSMTLSLSLGRGI